MTDSLPNRAQQPGTKTARQWAADIAKLPSLEDRRAALQGVPSALLPLVKSHLQDRWWRQSHNPGRVNANQ